MRGPIKAFSTMKVALAGVRVYVLKMVSCRTLCTTEVGAIVSWPCMEGHKAGLSSA